MHVPWRKSSPVSHTGLAVHAITSFQGISISLRCQNKIALTGKKVSWSSRKPTAYLIGEKSVEAVVFIK